MIGEDFFEEGASKLQLMGKKGPVMLQDHLVLSPVFILALELECLIHCHVVPYPVSVPLPYRVCVYHSRDVNNFLQQRDIAL